jgi:hypothetical protein
METDADAVDVAPLSLVYRWGQANKVISSSTSDSDAAYRCLLELQRDILNVELALLPSPEREEVEVINIPVDGEGLSHHISVSDDPSTPLRFDPHLAVPATAEQVPVPDGEKLTQLEGYSFSL